MRSGAGSWACLRWKRRAAAPMFPLRPVIGLSPPTVFRQRAAPGIYIAPARGPQLSGRVGFGSGATRGRILINQTPRVGIAGRQFGVRPGPFFSPVTVAAASYPGYLPSYDYERAALLSRLHELEAQRAGLQAHWRLLEDEARRAGAQPGWLRP